MPSVPMVSLKSHRYAGRLVAKGEPFYARTSDDAKVLRALKIAEDAPAVPAPPVPEVVPQPLAKVLEPENGMPADEPADEAVEEPEAPDAAQPMRAKRTYRRRDLTAEK